MPTLRLALASLLVLAACDRGESRPNLLLVSVDTLRADRLGCYGGAADVGTAICALGEGGARFTWAFSTAPSTAPSVASILTSQLPHAHGVTELARSRLADDAHTLAETLAAAGFATAAFVANPVLSSGRGFEQGFAIYDDRMQRREGNRALLEREAAEITDAALQWLRVARAPWFLWVHYQDPHGPYEPPGAAPAHDASGAATLPLLAEQSGWRGIPAYQALGGARAIPTYEARYADEIRWLDRHVARLVAAADTDGRRAAILLTADHGEAFGEDEFWFAHGHSLAIDQIRVPLLWRPATPAAPRVVAAPASTLDVAPTLLAAAGLAAPASMRGVALASDAAPSARPPIFAEHRLRAAVVVGTHYFTRDREPFAAPVPEPITGGFVPPLPPRSATLGPDGRAPAYTAELPPALEALLAAFVRDAGARTPTAERELDAASREALRALGYLE